MAELPGNDIANLKSRLNEDPRDFGAAVDLGNLYFDASEAAQAIVYYTAALRIRPNVPEVMTDMATMYWQNGDLGFAEQTFREVIGLHPGFGNAYLNLGLLLAHGKEQRKNALEIWDELVSNYPEHPASDRARQLLIEFNQ